MKQDVRPNYMRGNLQEEQYKRTLKKGLLTTRRPKKFSYKTNKVVYAFISILGCSDRRRFYAHWKSGFAMSTSIYNTRLSDDGKSFYCKIGNHPGMLFKFKTKDIKVEYYIGPAPF